MTIDQRFMARQVQYQATKGKCPGQRLLRASEQRSRPGKKLLDREWLGHVVVRARVEPLHAITRRAESVVNLDAILQ